MGDGDLFKALDELGEEWIGDVFDDDAEDAAATGDQAARMGVGKVLELLDGLPDALAEPFADRGERLMVRETVAMETFASAATERISGVLGVVLRLVFEPRIDPRCCSVNAMLLHWRAMRRLLARVSGAKARPIDAESRSGWSAESNVAASKDGVTARPKIAVEVLRTAVGYSSCLKLCFLGDEQAKIAQVLAGGSCDHGIAESGEERAGVEGGQGRFRIVAEGLRAGHGGEVGDGSGRPGVAVDAVGAGAEHGEPLAAGTLPDRARRPERIAGCGRRRRACDRWLR